MDMPGGIMIGGGGMTLLSLAESIVLMDYSELFADEGRYYCSPYVGIVR
jgi:hypothetical protein